MALSPDGRWAASGGLDMTVRIWDVERGTEKHRCKDGVVQSLAFSPDNRRLLSGGGDGSAGVDAGTTRGVRAWA